MGIGRSLRMMPPISYIKSFLDLDWTKAPYLVTLVLLFLISRVPLLKFGFGLDADAWRIANSAFDLKHSHVYHTSRFPGYPLPEFLNSLVIDHGWIATNSVTMILSFISVVFFARILKDLNVKNKGLLVLTYAFLPILWINSTNTMDYMWALTFIVIAWFFLLRTRWAIAGLMVGLAIGSRITSAILIFPFLYLVWKESRNIKATIYFLVPTVTISSVLFLPLFLQHGLGFLAYHPESGIEILRAWRLVARGFGVMPTLFGLALFLLSLKVMLRDMLKKDRNTIFLLSAVILVGILFITKPLQVQYLIPAIPFGLLLLNKIGKRGLVVILCILLLLPSFVSFVATNTKGGLVVHPPDGMIERNIEDRTERIDYLQKAIIRLTNLPTHFVVITTSHGPAFRYLLNNQDIWISNKQDAWDPKQQDIHIRYLVPLDQLQDYLDEGYTIYYLKGAHSSTRRVYDYDLIDYGAVRLDVDDRDK